MRKFKLQVQTTVDGYMAGPGGEMDWMAHPWTEDINAYAGALHEPVDCLVLGRKLAEGFIPHWAAGPEDEPPEAVEKMNKTPKVVISRTLTTSPWENARVASGLVETVDELKQESGGEIIAYGGSTLVTSLLAEGLLDELHIFVNPAAIGAGLPVFPRRESNQDLRLVGAHPFECGVTALHLEPKPS